METLHAHIEQFLQAKQLEVTSPRSIQDMAYFLRLIEEGLTTLYPNVSIEQLTPIQLRSLVEWWDQGKSGRNVQKATIKKALMFMKYFFRWLQDEQVIDRNPSEKLRYKPRVKYTPTARIQRSDIQKLLLATAGNQYLDKLAHVVVRVLLDTGMRAHELCALKLENAQLLASRIQINVGKGGKTGVIGFGKQTRQALDDYLLVRSALSRSVGDLLIVNSHGARMTERNLDRLLKSYSEKAGVSPVSAHQFRVTFAVEQFLAGASIIAVQSALRHSSIDMTLHYLRLAEQERHAMSCAMTSVVDALGADA